MINYLKYYCWDSQDKVKDQKEKMKGDALPFPSPTTIITI